MKDLLSKLDFEAAQYDAAARGLFIPMVIDAGGIHGFKVYLYIACGEAFYKGILYALEEELKKNG